MISPDPFVLTTATNESVESIDENHAPNIYYTASEVLVALLAIVGNALVITVFCKERRLRRRTNYYIVSLAVADLLVGLLGIPFALLAAVGLPKNLYACLLTISLLVVLCTISIFCLVAVSVDRYWAILYPMGYSRHVRTKTALVIISICWVAGTFIGFLPLMGWHQDVPNDVECFFLKVMDYNYLVFLYIVTIITPALVLAAFYAHIYSVVLKQMRRIVTMNPIDGSSNRSSGGTMLRMLGAAQKREVKATQNLSIIVLFFMICWIPLYTINFILAFCAECFEVNSTFMLFCIILSHMNSAGNPLLYAYHLKDFRAALKYFFCKLFTFGDGSSSSGRPSYGSNAAAQNNYVQNRLQSLRDNRSVVSLTTHTKYLSNSQLSLTSKLQSRSCSLTERPKLGSIIAQTAVLAAATAGDNAREIWRISEHPSVSEEQSKDYSFHECHTNNNLNRIGSDKSERLNNGYADIPLDEGEDDEVFVDAPITNVSNKYELVNSSSESTISNGHNPNIMTPLDKIKAKYFSSSSPQLTRGLFVVEAEITKEGKHKKCTRSVSDEKKVAKTFSFSGDFLHSSVKSLKLSPLKAVSEFLLHHSVKRSKSANKLNLNDDNDAGVVTPKQFSRKENSIAVN